MRSCNEDAPQRMEEGEGGESVRKRIGRRKRIRRTTRWIA